MWNIPNKLKVTYFDKGTGSGSIALPGKNGATRVQNTNSGDLRLQGSEMTGRWVGSRTLAVRGPTS